MRERSGLRPHRHPGARWSATGHRSQPVLQRASVGDVGRLLQRRQRDPAYTGGTIAQRPIVNNVFLGGSGAAPCTQDPYYARLQPGQPNCAFSATVNMDWGTRPGGTFSAILHIAGSNTDYTLTPPAGTPPNGGSGSTRDRCRSTHRAPRTSRSNGRGRTTTTLYLSPSLRHTLHGQQLSPVRHANGAPSESR